MTLKASQVRLLVQAKQTQSSNMNKVNAFFHLLVLFAAVSHRSCHCVVGAKTTTTTTRTMLRTRHAQTSTIFDQSPSALKFQQRHQSIESFDQKLRLKSTNHNNISEEKEHRQLLSPTEDLRFILFCLDCAQNCQNNGGQACGDANCPQCGDLGF